MELPARSTKGLERYGNRESVGAYGLRGEPGERMTSEEELNKMKRELYEYRQAERMANRRSRKPLRKAYGANDYGILNRAR